MDYRPVPTRALLSISWFVRDFFLTEADYITECKSLEYIWTVLKYFNQPLLKHPAAPVSISWLRAWLSVCPVWVSMLGQLHPAPPHSLLLLHSEVFTKEYLTLACEASHSSYYTLSNQPRVITWHCLLLQSTLIIGPNQPAQERALHRLLKLCSEQVHNILTRREGVVCDSWYYVIKMSIYVV